MHEILVDSAANGVFAIEVDILHNLNVERIVVVGMGNIGSRIALMLLQSGLPPSMLTIIDGDTVESHNVSNQLCGKRLGVAKVEGFRSVVAGLLGIETAEKITSYKMFLGAEDIDLALQLAICKNSILIMAIDNTACAMPLYNNIIRDVPSIYMVMAANFSRYLRSNNGAGAIGAVSMMTNSGYFKAFFEDFYLSGKEVQLTDENACRQPNAALPGQIVANLAVSRLINYLRRKASKLPHEISNDPRAMAITTGRYYTTSFVDGMEEVVTVPFEDAVVDVLVNLHTLELTPRLRENSRMKTKIVEQLIENSNEQSNEQSHSAQ